MAPIRKPSNLLGRTTISDVAKACGVSKTTVSKVVNLPPEQLDVSESARQKVLAACQKMGYRPNRLARALASGRTKTIGLVILETTTGYHSPLWQEITSTLVNSLHEKQYDVLFVPSADRAERCIQLLLDLRLEGCLLFHELTDPMAQALEEVNLPAVLINADGRGLQPSVVPDDVRGAKELTSHLISLGHRRILYVDSNPSPRHFSFHCRFEGYRQALAEAGLEDSVRKLSGVPQDLAAQIVTMTPRPTAVVSYDDRFTTAILHGLWKHGVHVPADMSIATFNNTELTKYSIPSLTTMEVPAAQMSRQGVQMILKQIETREKAPPKPILLPEKLVIGESTAPPPA